MDPTADWNFVDPTLAAPIDVDAYLRNTPTHATVKGMFLSATRALLPSSERNNKRYVAFREYPLVEYMNLTLEAAKSLHGTSSVREGLRRLGHMSYPTFADSMVGRILMGVLGGDLDEMFRRAPKAYEVSVRPVTVRSHQLGPAHWRVGFEATYHFLDSHQVGVLEGAILHHHRTPNIKVFTTSLDTGVMDVRWH